jgi:hypothetical protein
MKRRVHLAKNLQYPTHHIALLPKLIRQVIQLKSLRNISEILILVISFLNLSRSKRLS